MSTSNIISSIWCAPPRIYPSHQLRWLLPRNTQCHSHRTLAAALIQMSFDIVTKEHSNSTCSSFSSSSSRRHSRQSMELHPPWPVPGHSSGSTVWQQPRPPPAGAQLAVPMPVALRPMPCSSSRRWCTMHGCSRSTPSICRSWLYGEWG